MNYVDPIYKHGEEEILDLLAENKGIRAILAKAEGISRNPFIYLDPGLKVIAASGNTATGNPAWDKIIADGFVADKKIMEIFKTANIAPVHDSFLQSVDGENLILIINPVHVGSEFVGILVTGDVNLGFTMDSENFSRYIKKITNISMNRNQFYNTSIHSDTEFFFYGLLKNPLEKASLDLRQMALPKPLKEKFTVILYKPARESAIDPIGLKNKLTEVLPDSYSVIFEGSVVSIINQDEFSPCDNDFEKVLQGLAADHKLLICVSSWFTDVDKLKLNYDLLVSLRQIGNIQKIDQGVLWFKDHILDYLIFNEASKTPLGSLVHPAVQVLRAHDAANNTAFTASLKAYVYSMGDMAAAAKAMAIHYNTMKYRINSLCHITGLDLKDMDTLVSLYITFKLQKGFKNQ